MIRAACLIAACALAAASSHAQQERNFYDDFQGSSLNPAFRVLNPDRNRMALTQGEYLLLVTHHETKNVIEYNGTLPENYADTVRIAQPPQHREQWAQIRVGSGNSNVRVGMHVDQFRYLYFSTRKTLDGEAANAISERRDALLGEPVYLRFIKIGVEFEGQFSTNGVQWTSVGKQVLIDPTAKISIRVRGWGDSAESPVKLDSFEIVEILN